MRKHSVDNLFDANRNIRITTRVKTPKDKRGVLFVWNIFERKMFKHEGYDPSTVFKPKNILSRRFVKEQINKSIKDACRKAKTKEVK
jgi:hypothetical protein